MKKKIIIIGAGITGLVAAYYLSKRYNVIVVEKSSEIGGMSYSFKYKNFILDYGPHKIATQLEGIIPEIQNLTSLLKIKKKNSIFLQGTFFIFPLQLKQIAFKMPFTAFKSGIDIFSNLINKKPEINYENFFINRFGKTLYNLVFRDYAEKIWGNPKELDVELAKRRVAVSSIFELIKSTISKKTEKISVDYFYYPPKGISQLIDSLAQKIKKNKSKILTNTEIDKIDIRENKIISVKIKNKTYKVDFLVSTAPIKDLIRLFPAPTEVKKAAENLKYQSLNIIYFILKKPKALKDNWIFFPEKNLFFNRISEQKSFSLFTCPKDKTALIVETTKPTTEENIEKIKNQLISLNIFNEDEIEEFFIKKLEKAYPIYYKDFQQDLNLILNYLDKFENFLTIGRHGLFNYNNMDQCWDMAKKASEHIIEEKSKEEWKKTRKSFDSYKIVD